MYACDVDDLHPPGQRLKPDYVYDMQLPGLRTVTDKRGSLVSRAKRVSPRLSECASRS
jgi:hypothetical protein